MATTCPNCGTDNRPFAKYCIECVAVLPATFAPTVFLPRPGVASAAATPAARPSSVPHVTTAPMPSRLADERATRGTMASAASKPAARKGLWVSVAAFAIALAVGAGGWMIAGAGGWYIYSTASTASMPGSAEAVPSRAAEASLLPAAVVEAPAAPMPSPVGPAVAVAAVPALPMPVGEAASARLAAAPAKPPAKSASGASSRAPPDRAPTPRESKTRTVAAASAERSGSPADPCTGLSFFALSRCMAAQCAKPAYSPHAACEGVRRQQQLMEEKRNLSLNR